ncbi:MAG: toxin HicA [Pirellulaceae bacterium]|nr:toxin HicA [Pirellulaceae bacterium]
MIDLSKFVDFMKRNPQNVRFIDLCLVCDHYFGKPRQTGTSHRIYRMPWKGDPRVNIQSSKGKAKAYQVRQVLKAIKRLEDEKNEARQ